MERCSADAALFPWSPAAAAPSFPHLPHLPTMFTLAAVTTAERRSAYAPCLPPSPAPAAPLLASIPAPAPPPSTDVTSAEGCSADAPCLPLSSAPAAPFMAPVIPCTCSPPAPSTGVTAAERCSAAGASVPSVCGCGGVCCAQDRLPAVAPAVQRCGTPQVRVGAHRGSVGKCGEVWGGRQRGNRGGGRGPRARCEMECRGITHACGVG